MLGTPFFSFNHSVPPGLAVQATLDASDAALGLQACDWLNVSACHASVELSKRGEGLMVVAYNPLAWGRVAAVRVPLAGEGAWRVTGGWARLPCPGPCATGLWGMHAQQSGGSMRRRPSPPAGAPSTGS